MKLASNHSGRTLPPLPSRNGRGDVVARIGLEGIRVFATANLRSERLGYVVLRWSSCWW